MRESNVTPAIDGPRAGMVVEDYLRSIEKAFTTKDVKAVEALFLPSGYLRE